MKEQHKIYQMSTQDKRLFNLLVIKMYDISQNIQIIGTQLTNNQIKDVIANTYHIFSQLKNIFNNAGVIELYQIVRKMQINSVALSSILTERIDKKTEQIKPKILQPQNKIQIHQEVQGIVNVQGKGKSSKLGGICLYNESYMRGLQYYQIDAQSIEQMSGKCRIKQSKRLKQQFLTSISKQLDAKAEVEVETISDQIKKYIKDYKQNSKINNFVSYQKQLVEIIDFFKISELEAMSFLNKSPKNQEYTEDYLNRLHELESEFKKKQKSEKSNIIEKLKYFILNLREKLQQMQQKYQQKNHRLHQFEMSLRKQMVCNSTQTYDGLESRLKSQELTIKQLEQRYRILAQIKSKQINFESKYYEILSEISIKNTEMNKFKTMNIELQSQIQYLKKIIRQNKQKLNVDLKQIERRRAKNKKIAKQISRKLIQQPNNDQRQSIQTTIQQIPRRRSSKLERKTKRIERLQTSSVFKPNQLQQFSKENGLAGAQDLTVQNESEIPKQSILKKQAQPKRSFRTQQKKVTLNATSPIPSKQGDNNKQSFFKNEYRKNTKKSEQQRQVSFLQQKSKKAFSQAIQNHSENEIIPINLSIDNIKNDSQYENEDTSQKTSKKNTLKQVITSGGCSMRSFQGQYKRSAKNVSKKCIILKDNKQKDKNMLATTIKFQNLSINQVLVLTIYPQPTVTNFRKQRPSYPFTNSQLNSGTSLKSNQKLAQMVNEMSKIKLSHQSSYNSQGIKSIQGKQKNNGFDILKKKDYNSKKSLSKKQNSNLSSKFIPVDSQNIQNSNNYQRIKKIEKLQIQKHLELFDSSNIKQISAYLQNLKLKNRESIGNDRLNQILQQNQQNPLDHSQATTFVNYIIEQLAKEQLNLEEFKQIMHCIEQNDNPLDQPSYKNSLNRQSSLPIFHDHHEGKRNINSTRYSKPHQYRQKKQSKEMQQSFKVNIKDNRDICGIGERIYLSIRQIHKKMSNCHNKDNLPCEHLIKYINILKKINEMSYGKQPIKLHIEKIGQSIQQNCEKSHKKISKNSDKLQMLIQKASGSNYYKTNPYQSQGLKQYDKDRILPIINSTSSTYYKPKNKQYTVK